MNFHTEAIGYVGRQHKGGCAGYDADFSSFMILEVESGTVEASELFMANALKNCPKNIASKSLSISQAVEEEMDNAGLDSLMAAAVGIVVAEELHLYTKGTGAIYVIRKGEAAALISGDQTAVGKPQEGDVFYFVNSAFIEATGGEAEFIKSIQTADCKSYFSSIPNHIKNPQLAGAVLLAVRFAGSVQTPQQSSISEPASQRAPAGPAHVIIGKNRKIITFVGVVIIAVILIWSVVLGYRRRAEETANKLIAATRVVIGEKLEKAAEEAFLNPQTAKRIIDESYQEYESLRTKVGSRGGGELASLYEEIKNKENEITHKEEKQSEEFYDLSLETKGATGVKMYLMDEELLVLDNKRGAIYEISAEKKSIGVYADESIKSASLVAGYDGDIYYFIPDKGLYVWQKDKADNIIVFDPEWGQVSDLSFFNGNAYLLDQEGNQIQKYSAIEGGFSVKKPYFAPDAINIKESASIAIDSSVYIGTGRKIYKYTGGIRDEFPAELPEADARVDKVITTKDLDRLYAWDKKNGALYLFTKEGAFDRQIESSQLAQADDVVIHGTRALILIKEKIYTIDVR